MTDLLYLDDCYMREFEAKVLMARGERGVLDRTCFYPEGGGQPADEGVLLFEDATIRVWSVKKIDGAVWHFLRGMISEGANVTGKLDWDRRYAHMRYHTAQHMLSAVFLDEFNAKTLTDQLHADRARMDFEIEEISPNMAERITGVFNDWVRRNVDIRIYLLPRERAMRELDPSRVRLNLLPKGVKELRIVEIEGLDKCACAGTHVKKTSEVGTFRITKIRSKGKRRKRVEFVLSESSRSGCSSRK